MKTKEQLSNSILMDLLMATIYLPGYIGSWAFTLYIFPSETSLFISILCVIYFFKKK